MTDERGSKTSVIFVVYLFMFSILKIIWVDFSDNSTTLTLAICAILLFLGSLIYTRKVINKPFVLSIGFVVLNLTFFLLNFIFRTETGLFYERLYEFIIFGLIPVLLFSHVRNLEPLFKTYVILSILLFLLYAIDPFLGYKYSGNYMDYGYQIMLPAFFGMHLGRLLFNWNYLFVLQVSTFLLILLFGNRMASIACLFFVLMVDFFYIGFTLKNKIKYFSIIIISCLGILFFKEIIIWIVEILEKNNLSSYSVRTVLNYSDLGSFSAGRDIIWERSLEMIVTKPIFGHGIGTFEIFYGTYPHNILLEILISFGIVGFLLYFCLIFISFKNIIRGSGLVKLLGIVLFCTSFPKLLTSIYIFKEPTFWLLLFYGFLAPYLSKYNQINVHKK